MTLPDWAESMPRAQSTLQGWMAKGSLSVFLMGGVLGVRLLTTAPQPTAATRSEPSRAPVVEELRSAPAQSACVPAVGAEPVKSQLTEPSVADTRPLRRAVRTTAARRMRPGDVATAAEGPAVVSKERPLRSDVSAPPVVDAAASGDAVPARAVERFVVRPLERPEPPGDAEEMHWLARAEAALRADPARALQLLRAGDARFPDGYFRQERAYLTVMATLAIGKSDEARRNARQFLDRYPRSIYAERVRAALHSREDSVE